MGLFDSLENAAMSKVMGSTSNPLASGLLQMIQNQPGGLQGLVQSFHDKGMGGLVSSWVGSGENCPITADQIHQVLGSDQVKDASRKSRYFSGHGWLRDRPVTARPGGQAHAERAGSRARQRDANGGRPSARDGEGFLVVYGKNFVSSAIGKGTSSRGCGKMPVETGLAPSRGHRWTMFREGKGASPREGRARVPLGPLSYAEYVRA